MIIKQTNKKTYLKFQPEFKYLKWTYFLCMSSIQNKSVGIMQGDDKGLIRYCVECGAKMPKSQKICPACGESQ